MMSLFTLRKKSEDASASSEYVPGQHRTMQRAHVRGCLELGKL